MQTKNKFLVTPNFHRTLRVQGVLWSEKTILTPFSAHNNPWCKKQNFKNLLPSMKSINGSQIKGAPYPEIRVRHIFNGGPGQGLGVWHCQFVDLQKLGFPKMSLN
jgi:hypothetical protein